MRFSFLMKFSGFVLVLQFIINNQALPCLLALLTNNHKKSIKKEACWTISNITAGNKDQIQAVIDANIIPPLVSLLATAEFDIKKEAAWAISNATSGGTHDQIKYLVNQGCIKPLCDLLTCPDARIVTVSLEGLENILRSENKKRIPETVVGLTFMLATLTKLKVWRRSRTCRLMIITKSTRKQLRFWRLTGRKKMKTRTSHLALKLHKTLPSAQVKLLLPLAVSTLAEG